MRNLTLNERITLRGILSTRFANISPRSDMRDLLMLWRVAFGFCSILHYGKFIRPTFPFRASLGT